MQEIHFSAINCTFFGVKKKMTDSKQVRLNNGTVQLTRNASNGLMEVVVSLREFVRLQNWGARFWTILDHNQSTGLMTSTKPWDPSLRAAGGFHFVSTEVLLLMLGQAKTLTVQEVRLPKQIAEQQQVQEQPVTMGLVRVQNDVEHWLFKTPTIHLCSPVNIMDTDVWMQPSMLTWIDDLLTTEKRRNMRVFHQYINVFLDEWIKYATQAKDGISNWKTQTSKLIENAKHFGKAFARYAIRHWFSRPSLHPLMLDSGIFGNDVVEESLCAQVRVYEWLSSRTKFPGVKLVLPTKRDLFGLRHLSPTTVSTLVLSKCLQQPKEFAQLIDAVGEWLLEWIDHMLFHGFPISSRLQVKDFFLAVAPKHHLTRVWVLCTMSHDELARYLATIMQVTESKTATVSGHWMCLVDSRWMEMALVPAVLQKIALVLTQAKYPFSTNGPNSLFFTQYIKCVLVLDGIHVEWSADKNTRVGAKQLCNQVYQFVKTNAKLFSGTFQQTVQSFACKHLLEETKNNALLFDSFFCQLAVKKRKTDENAVFQYKKQKVDVKK